MTCKNDDNYYFCFIKYEICVLRESWSTFWLQRIVFHGVSGFSRVLWTFYYPSQCHRIVFLLFPNMEITSRFDEQLIIFGISNFNTEPFLKDSICVTNKKNIIHLTKNNASVISTFWLVDSLEFFLGGAILIELFFSSFFFQTKCLFIILSWIASIRLILTL